MVDTTANGRFVSNVENKYCRKRIKKYFEVSAAADVWCGDTKEFV